MGQGIARAQVADEDRATARALARHGYEAQQRGDYATAAGDFQRADALVHAPTLLLGLARAQAGLGRLVEAQETCERILREGVDAHASAVFVKAVADARREASALRPRLAWMTIEVRGPPAPRVEVDGAVIAEAALGVGRASDPGQHTVKAFAEGFEPGEETFVVAEGARRTVTLSLHSLPIARQPATAAQRLRGEQVPPPDEASGSTPFGAKAGIAALGLGGAGLLVGGVTGVLVLVKHAALTRACPDGHCPPSESGDVATYHALAAVSTVSTLVGAGAAVVGAALLIATPRTAPVAVYAGFLRIEIVGSFR